MKIKLIRTTFTVFLSSSLALSLSMNAKVYSQTTLNKSEKKAMARNSQVRPFRYIIYLNEMNADEDYPSDPQKGSRYLEVLLDRKAFSEKTLRELFLLLSERFPKPFNMDIQVFTDIEQVPTPEEMGRGMSEQPDNLWVEKYPSAFFIRQNGNEIIRYTPNPPYRKDKTIVVKGKDIQK